MMNSFMSCSFSTIIILAMKIVNGMDCNCPDLQSVTSIHPTITALPLTLPKTRVSLRNCCHRGNITTRTKQPNSSKTVRSSLYAQTAPLSQISRFSPLSLTSKPCTQRVNYRLFTTQRGKMLPNLSFKPLYKPILYCSKVVQLLCKCRLFLLGTILLPSSVCTIFVHYDIASSAFFLLGIHKHILSDNWRMVLLY